MSKTPIYKPFKEVITNPVKERAWAKYIPPATQCMIATFNYGEQIGDQTGIKFIDSDPDKFVGIILDGMAEVYDQSSLGPKYLAYRPIRLLEPGDLFGDFSIVDKVLDVEGLSRPSEVFRVCAGRQSVIVMDDVANSHIDLFSDEEYPEERKPHLFLQRNAGHFTTRVAFVDCDGFLHKDHPFFLELLCTAWRRARTYRTSVNSYNFMALLEFRRILYREADALSSKKIYSPKTAKKALLSVFADALYDALNRPLRNEPVFACRSGLLSPECLKELSRIKIEASAILLACQASAAPQFYYPIDLNNFIINSYCSLSGLTKEGKDIFGWERESDPTASRPRDFYRALAERVLAKHAKSNADYKWKVSCHDTNALDGKVLHLKFVSADSE